MYFTGIIFLQTLYIYIIKNSINGIKIGYIMRKWIVFHVGYLTYKVFIKYISSILFIKNINSTLFRENYYK